MNYSTSGYSGVSFSATDARMNNDAFWSLFAQTLGVSAMLSSQPLNIADGACSSVLFAVNTRNGIHS